MNKKRNKRRVAKRKHTIRYVEIDPIDWTKFNDGIVKLFNDEPFFNCCKGCANWKGAMTVCNCTLPAMEMQRTDY